MVMVVICMRACMSRDSRVEDSLIRGGAFDSDREKDGA